MTNVIQIPQLPAVSSLNGTEQYEAVQAGSSVQITLAQIASYVLALFPYTALTAFPSRVVTSNATANFLTTDTALLINKTVGSPTTTLLLTPILGRALIVKDMKGDAGTNNITLDAGSGHLINGQQTLVMNANYGTTMLIGMSSTQWGTLI